MSTLDKPRLLELAEACEKAGGPDRALDCAIAVAALGFFELAPKWEGGPVGFGYIATDGAPVQPGHCGDHLVKPFTASLDTAMTLCPSWAFPLLDWTGPHCRLRNSVGLDFADYTSLAPTACRALLAAILRCLAAQGGDA